ncbi:MAG: hypothetical protein O7F73_00945, partial [Gammaproteobacteria bacterium]|nr:hypothetical protein [Gammaproteobacteria bacterium]
MSQGRLSREPLSTKKQRNPGIATDNQAHQERRWITLASTADAVDVEQEDQQNCQASYALQLVNIAGPGADAGFEVKGPRWRLYLRCSAGD